MEYLNIVEGTFYKRLNRFIAEVFIEGQVETVHVKNTGRCKELFIEGAPVYLEPATNPNRKTRFSLIGIKKGDLMINIDSQIPNGVVGELLLSVKEYQQTGLTQYPNLEIVKEFDLKFPKLKQIKREKTYGKSRFDIYYELEDGTSGFIEVKGVTLEENGVARFPDAPTSRGTKHVNELMDSVKEGYSSYIFFVIQLSPCLWFEPNKVTDIPFSNAIKTASESGVPILCYDSIITENSIHLNQRIEVKNL